ncbi:MAG: nucleoside recognition domain-containing protein [Tateyamaria sp.]
MFTDVIRVYWELVRIIVPVAIITEGLVRLGAIAAIAPAFSPIMAWFGLPPELGLAWLTGIVVGIWAGVAMVVTLLPGIDLTVADITVFSALLLFVHALPVEQKIIQRAGPSFLVTTALRVLGGLIYASLLHAVFSYTGSLNHAPTVTFVAGVDMPTWGVFLAKLAEAMAWMFALLLSLTIVVEVMKTTGLMDGLAKILSPILGAAGIAKDARHFTIVGLLLGISYGAGLLLSEAKSGTIPIRQVFLACVFMGFAHGMIEDTILVLALGADFTSVFVGRIVFATIATAIVGKLLLFLDRYGSSAKLISQDNP